MPIDVNGYNNTFSAFVQFAENSFRNGAKKAIANVGGPLGGRTIVASTTDGVGFVGNLFRSRWDEVANDNARKLFLNAVTRMFGGRSNIPESVWKAINLQDYGRGAPLTARRIQAVKAAVDAHLSAPPDKLDVTVGGKTRYACVEGPDFDGHEVDFDELMHRNGTYREREAECRMMKLADNA